LLARTEGLFVEPASASALAGIAKANKAGLFPKDSVLAATMTGHGLKDPDTAIKSAGFEPVVVKPDMDSVMNIIGL